MMMNIERLPRELVSNVLSRLPVKVLLLCKCVCKSWFNLITNPHFITNYYVVYNNLKHSKSKEENLLVIRRPLFSGLKTYISVLSLNLNDPKKLISSSLLNPPSIFEIFADGYRYWTNEIMGPCNGIYFLDGNPNIMMNPSLRQFIVLPQSPFTAPCGDYSFIDYAGFGFDPKTNDYKVVVISTRKLDAELYSFNSNSWRKLDAASALPLPIGIWGSSQVYTYVNNCYHWWGFVDECGVKEDVVLAFDMVNESFRKIQVRPKIRYSAKECIATVVPFNESATIGVIVKHLRGTKTHFEVWVMKDYWDEGSWTKQYTVGPVQEIYKLVGFYRSKRILREDSDERLRLVLFDPDSELNTRNLQVDGSNDSIRAARYMESLVSLQRREETSHQLFSYSLVQDPLLRDLDCLQPFI